MLPHAATKLIEAFWIIAPAYAANAFPPLLKGKHPLDLGRKMGKNRILGDGKTFEGTFGGIAFGTLVGYIQQLIHPYFIEELQLPPMTLHLAFLLALGAVLGDITWSFIKRRLGIPRGQSVPIANQLDFLLGALLLGSLIYEFECGTIFFLIMITPAIHLLANTLAFIAKLKRVPW